MANIMRFGIELTNFKEFADLMRDLPAAMQQRVTAVAVGDALKPLQRLAKAMAPQRTGALKKSIVAVVRKYPQTGTTYGAVGPSTDYFAGGKKLKKGASRRGADKPANYAHLVEYGHWTRDSSPFLNRSAKGRFVRDRSLMYALQGPRNAKWVAPRPFLRPAVAIATPIVKAHLADGIKKGMEREIKRLSGKLKRLAA